MARGLARGETGYVRTACPDRHRRPATPGRRHRRTRHRGPVPPPDALPSRYRDRSWTDRLSPA